MSEPDEWESDEDELPTAWLDPLLGDLDAADIRPARSTAALRRRVEVELLDLVAELRLAADAWEDGWPASAPCDGITIGDLIDRFEAIAGSWNRARRRGVAPLIERAGTSADFASAAELIRGAWAASLDALDTLGDRSPPPDQVPPPPAVDPVAALTAAPAAPPR
jgi:hypothetical protein